MTEAQKRLRELRERQSKERQRMAELARESELTDETRAEFDRIEAGTPDLERQIRAATVAVDEEERASTIDKGATAPDAETRERIELRSRVSIGAFLVAALKGKAVAGAEAELQQAAGVDGIPLEVFDTREVLEARAARDRGAEHRNITPSPGTVGVNLDPVRPAVFAPSIAPRLMIDMPMVGTGTYATGTISSATGSVVTADAVAKSADVPFTAGAITTQTTTPKRVGGRLGLTLEDIAAVGTANFESVLRENLSLVLSDELDDQMINGDGSNNDLTGIFQRLTDPAAPAANVETWARFLTIQASGIDGLWATELSHIGMVVNPETYRLAAVTFQGTDAEESAAMYMKRSGDSFFTNKRMPDKANHIAPGILCRKGRMGMRTAVCPHWGYVSIDDIYSGARKGERYFTVSVLVGDVILVQPDAYEQVAFRVST